jgi:hypothetical protein
MKHLLTLSLAFFLVSCTASYAQQVATAKEYKTGAKGTKNGNGTSAIKNGNLHVQGAYSMLRQVVNSGTGDTVTNAKQFKIYTDRYMIYAGPRSAQDSLANYGIGTYSIQNGKVFEKVFYTASGGSHEDSYELAINKTANGYTQIINFPPDSSGRKFILTEDYKSAGNAITSPLDGGWKQTKTTYTPKNGSAMTDNNPTEFKVYQSGYFIWASTSHDSASNKPVSYFGYGSFKMNGSNKITEVNSNSTFPTMLVGKPVTVQLQFMGKDGYQQTIKYPSGDQAVEVYERLK